MPVLKFLKEFSSVFTGLNKLLSSNQFGSITSNITVTQLRNHVKLQKNRELSFEMKDQIPLNLNTSDNHILKSEIGQISENLNGTEEVY